jgi:hypothetical protein
MNVQMTKRTAATLFGPTRLASAAVAADNE